MKTISALIFALLISVPSLANNTTDTESAVIAAPTWNIDHSHSAVNFQIRHFFTPVPGMFQAWGGTIQFDANNLEGSKIDISIDIESVNTKNDRRDAHLRNADFFDAEKYPTMTFVSNTIRSAGDNKFIATGDLTIKDVTQTIELPFEFLGAMEHPGRANTMVAGFKANYSLLRNDFGVGTGDYIQTAVIGNEVSIEVLLEVLNTSAE
jgi:polyisoprenoid-binding protein YceI